MSSPEQQSNENDCWLTKEEFRSEFFITLAVIVVGVLSLWFKRRSMSTCITTSETSKSSPAKNCTSKSSKEQESDSEQDDTSLSLDTK